MRKIKIISILISIIMVLIGVISLIYNDSNSETSNKNIFSAMPSGEYKIEGIDTLNQFPEMPTGCEITSTTMLLNWYGVNVDKEELGESIEKADVPSYVDGTLQGASPNEYFIGDPFSSDGYGVYHKPIANLIDQYTDGKSKDITGCSFNKLLRTVANGYPVVTWVTINMKESSVGSYWTNGDETIEWIIPEHAVLLVGFNENEVIINDPYTGTEYTVDKDIFENRWISLGRQAVTISD
ncbi:Hypothetical protein CM240_0218 [Clostridium bornimense]|uniref:Peptidase C39-like domain-containing protein n=1 Tax=Clostridium bornimense TaxID=1216932 RepID=W6RT23_9CLOT|nr:C39 family peptidase [Clostridium bornimense]CDM67388.1 Hypothetical protein CM240_0218 [Clostridium bornimense]